MTILTTDNQQPITAVKKILEKFLYRLQRSGSTIQQSLQSTVRNHVKTIYPGSEHYNPNKITPNTHKDGRLAEGSIKIDIAGICRVYHSHTLKAKHAKYLAIPIHREAYGRKPREFKDTFLIKSKKGNLLIAQNNKNKLAFLYVLKDKVFQPQDKRLMPSDSTLANNILARIRASLSRI